MRGGEGLKRPAAIGGFTLMETLVMLMLVSMAATLMFQMLAGYQAAQRRVAGQAELLDRSALVHAWFVDTARGLHPGPTAPLKGAPEAFSGQTLNPLLATPGAPTRFAWALEADGGETRLVYSEGGKIQWSLPLRDAEEARFAYAAPDGRMHDQWPPALGQQQALPAAVALMIGSGPAERVWLAAVLGPLDPRVDPFELEQE